MMLNMLTQAVGTLSPHLPCPMAERVLSSPNPPHAGGASGAVTGQCWLAIN